MSYVMVITGTSRGLGYEMANYFLEKDFLVIGCSRGDGVIIHPNYKHYSLDVCNEQSGISWAIFVNNKFGKGEALVCKVGLVKLGALTGAI